MTITRRRSSNCGVATVLLLLACVWQSARCEGAETFNVDKVTFKSTYVRNDERVSRIRLSASGDDLSTVGEAGDVVLSSNDTLTVQVSLDPPTVTAEQVMLRFENKRLHLDNLFALTRTGSEYKVELKLRKEIGADRAFWAAQGLDGGYGGDTYSVTVMVGDAKLADGGYKAWSVTKKMRWHPDDLEFDKVFRPVQHGVFEFDIRVKTDVLLPEFHTPLPVQERAAKWYITAAIVACMALAFPALFATWFHMGALPLNLKAGHGSLFVSAALHLCIIGHIAALVMFWVKWNIITTWKVMGAIMVPTLIFMRAFLQDDENVENADQMKKNI